MATILNVRVTISQYGFKDSYYPDVYPTFNVLRGQKVQYDDYNNELLVKVPGSSHIRRVKISKANMEKFTEYIF